MRVLYPLFCIACLISFQPPLRGEADETIALQQDQIQVLRERVDFLRTSNDIVSLRQLAVQAKAEWLSAKGVEYYPVILDLCLALNSLVSTQPDVYDVMEDLAVSAIDAPNEKPPEITAKLILLLGDRDYSRGQLRGEAWVKERRVRVERWLKVWKSMVDRLATLPDPSGPVYPQISPPDETGLPDGADPSAIKDPILRKKYEDAIAENSKRIDALNKKQDLRDLVMSFARPAKRYIIEAYCKPPYNTVELELLLADSVVVATTRTEIIDEVKRRITVRTETEARMAEAAKPKPPEPPPTNASLWQADARLQVKVSFVLRAPKVEDVLGKLREATGVTFSRTDDIQNRAPAFGSMHENRPAWQVMDFLAASKRVEGRWEKLGDGYRLTSNGTPVTLSEEQPKPAETRREVERGNLWTRRALIAAGVVVFAGAAYWLFRRQKARP